MPKNQPVALPAKEFRDTFNLHPDAETKEKIKRSIRSSVRTLQEEGHKLMK